MTYLFSLALRGVGTADIEAFGTYIHRLAAAHGISTGRLLAHVIAWHTGAHKDQQNNLAGIQASLDMCIFVRPNNATKQLVEIIADATGTMNLRCGTFLALQEALDRSMRTFVSRVRWCPACMSEFETLGDPGYFKLLWQLQAISHCPTHGLPLRNKCAACGSYQSGMSARGDCTACIRCGNPLSNGYGMERRVDSWEANGADLIDLVESIASDVALGYPVGGVRNVLTTIFYKAWADEHESRFWELIPRDECIGIVTGDQPVTLNTARRVAYRLGMRLSDLLAGTVSMTSEVLDPAWTAVLPEEMHPQKRRRSRDKIKVLEKLRILLSQDEYKNCPPALVVVAAHIGVSVGYLHYHFPTVAKEVLEQHKVWEENELRRKRLQARSAALAFLNEEKYAFEQMSRKNALRVLRAETGLPKNVLREEIGAVFQARLRPINSSL